MNGAVFPSLRLESLTRRIGADTAGRGAVGAGLIEGGLKLRLGGRALDLDVKTIFVRLAADGPGFETLEVHAGIAERGQEAAETAGTVGQFDDERGAVVLRGRGVFAMTEQVKLRDVWYISRDGEVQQRESMALCILARADGGGTAERGGFFSGLGGAGFDDAPGVWVVRFQPFITMEKRHGV